jgi:hypothetical protein
MLILLLLSLTIKIEALNHMVMKINTKPNPALQLSLPPPPLLLHLLRGEGNTPVSAPMKSKMTKRSQQHREMR